MPCRYNASQRKKRDGAITSIITIKQKSSCPVSIQVPTFTRLKILVDRKTPVNAPAGASNKESPSSLSENCKRSLIAGIAATQTPNIKLEAAKRKPTANAGLCFMNDIVFASI